MKTLKTILYSASLFIFWLILSGDDHPFAMALGFVISICIVWMNHKLIFDDHGRKLSFKKVGHLFVFIFVLIKEIWIANIDVAKLVLSRELKIEPSFFVLKHPLHSNNLKVLYANAITLTPGTLTVDLDEDTFLVHALTKKAGEGLVGSALEKAIEALEDEHA